MISYFQSLRDSFSDLGKHPILVLPQILQIIAIITAIIGLLITNLIILLPFIGLSAMKSFDFSMTLPLAGMIGILALIDIVALGLIGSWFTAAT